MQGIVRTFLKAKETKNAIKYDEAPKKGEPQVFGSIYMQKWVAEDIEAVQITAIAGKAEKVEKKAAKK